MKNTSRIDFLYHLIYQLPVSILFSWYFLTYVVTESGLSHPILLAVLFSMILPFFRILKLRGRLIMTGLVLELLLVMVLMRPEGKRLSFFTENPVLWELLGIAVLTFFIVLLMNRSLIVKLLVSILFAAALIICLLYQEETAYYQVLLSIILPVLTSLEIVQRFWKKQGDTDRKKHLVFVSPFILVLLLVLLLFSVPEEPYDWHFFRKIYASVSGFFDRVSIAVFTGFGDSYENQIVGFSEGGFIPGSVQNAPKDVLEIRFENNNNYQIYLTGKIFDEFNGKEWKNTSKSSVNTEMMDSLETYAYVKSRDASYLNDYLRRTNISIAYRHFRSKTVFAPLKSLISPFNFKDIRYYFSGTNLRSDILISYRDAYNLSYYRVNQDQKVFSELTKNPVIPDPDSWDSARMAFDLEHNDEFSYSAYASYRNEMFGTFLKDFELSDRTERFIDTLITDTDSDLDKLKKIELVFSDYPYDQDPGSIPENIDTPGKYLDYFLFENPRGFCSHYATAFVLIARALGIPARYCQGYYVPYEKAETVYVSSSMAHAWPEAYIEGVGWLRFEPTPGYKVYSGWAVANRDPKDTSNDPIPLRPDIPEIDIPDIEPEEIIPEENETHDYWKIYVIIGVLLLLSLLLFILFEFIHIRRIYKKADNNLRIRIMFRRNMKLLQYMDVSSIRQGETLSEYRNRAEKYVSQEGLKFIENYEDVIYGNSPVSEEICRISETSNRALKKELKKDKPYTYGLSIIRSYL